MRTADYDFELPPEHIAQEPPAVRGTSRMMVLHRADGRVEHRAISDLPGYLDPGDLLVLNDTRVLPARLKGAWADTGGAVEFLLLEKNSADPAVWQVLCGSGRKVRPGLRACFGDARGELSGEVIARGNEGLCDVRFFSNLDLLHAFELFGQMPLPPYIRRDPDDARRASDNERYQTVFAREPGAAAAPTAGLHFTGPLFEKLEAQGVGRAFVTLHTGLGTFRPVTAERLEDHAMHAEWYNVPPATVAGVERCHERKRRVVAVGSTTVRTLESATGADGILRAGPDRSSIFIYPPYTFRQVDAILTNFHLPKSTLLMMMAAFAGREKLLAAYAEAVHHNYRFFSYGDCMLIL